MSKKEGSAPVRAGCCGCAGGCGASAGLGWSGGESKERSPMDPVGTGAGINCAGGSVFGGGAGLGAGAAAEAAVDGLTSQALSSKPENALRIGADVNGVAAPSEGALLLPGSLEFCLNASASTTLFVCTVGAGRPLLVLFRSAPPGPEKSPPAAPLASPASLPLALLNLASSVFMTRRISPSFRPKVRSNCGCTSGRTSWPI